MAISSKENVSNQHNEEIFKIVENIVKKKKKKKNAKEIIYMLNKLINSCSYGIYCLSKVPTHRAPKNHSLDIETLKILTPTHTIQGL